MYKNMLFTKYFKAFSLVEILVALIIVSLIMAAMAPVITKRLSSSGITIGAGGGMSNTLSASCEAFGANCTLCYEDKCISCSISCSSNQAADIDTCSCKSCSSLYGNECLKCNMNECLECNLSHYAKNGRCEICPIGSYCNGTNSINCGNGKYTNLQGQTSCNNCEAGYQCANGIRTVCVAGTYSQANASTCETCPKGYYCSGASDRTQCVGFEYQSLTGQTSCQNCPLGYYVSNDRTSCNICEVGYACAGDGVRNQCPPGSYTNTTGLQACIPCPAGYVCSGGSNLSQCSAGTYSANESATSCTTCPAGYYCLGGTNLTSCSNGYYSTTTGASSSNTCVTCSSKTSNCSACDVSTGVCSACNSGFTINSNNTCDEENPCGDLALKVTISGSDYCITKYNIGDGGLTLPSGILNVTAGSQPSSSTNAIWCFKAGFDWSTYGYNNTANSGCSMSGYNACTRTVCGSWPLNLMENICSNFSYNGMSGWSALTSTQWTALTNAQLKELNICSEASLTGFSTCAAVQKCPIPALADGYCGPSVNYAKKSTYCIGWGNCKTEYFPFSVAPGGTMKNSIQMGIEAGYDFETVENAMSYITGASIRCIKKL